MVASAVTRVGLLVFSPSSDPVKQENAQSSWNKEAFWKILKFILKDFSTHYVKGVQIWTFSGPYFPAFGMNTEKYRPEKPLY